MLDRRRQRTRAFFDDEASGWDALRSQLLNETAALASLLPLVPRGLSVVDIGTGTGGMLPTLSEFAGRIAGVDESAQMLRQARDRARRMGLKKVEFHKAEMTKLPFADGTFDAAFAALVLHHAAKPAQAVAEMAQVVRPGGHLVVVDLRSHGQDWLREEQADVWLGFALEEVEALLRKVKLESVRVRVVSKAAGPKGGEPLELFVASAAKPQG